jgi:hypothetical protein
LPLSRQEQVLEHQVALLPRSVSDQPGEQTARNAVPEAGISFGELSRLLRAHFGHDLHIEGDVVQTAEGGLALTVRRDGVPANPFVGKALDLASSRSDAAEYVYAQSEPVLSAY